MKKARKNVQLRPKPVLHARLISQLENVEDKLQRWIKSSPDNLNFFRRDPIGAMRTAGLDIEDDIMLELETVTSSIARKLK